MLFYILHSWEITCLLCGLARNLMITLQNVSINFKPKTPQNVITLIAPKVSERKMIYEL